MTAEAIIGDIVHNLMVRNLTSLQVLTKQSNVTVEVSDAVQDIE